MNTELAGSVNAINLPRIEAYLNDLAHKNPNPLIQKWIKSNLRNYILRDDNPNKIKLTDRNQFSKLGIHVEPPWLVGKPLPDNLYFVALNPALGAMIEAALHHLHYLIDMEGAKDLSKVSVPDAVAAGEARHEMLRRKLEDEHFERDGIKDLGVVSGGFKWVSIITKEGFRRESRFMGHCLGQDGNIESYWGDYSRGAIEIWSLRDNQNKPHVTCEIKIADRKMEQMRPKGATISDQFKGMETRYWKPCLEVFRLEYCKERVRNVKLTELQMNFSDSNFWRPYLTGYNLVV